MSAQELETVLARLYTDPDFRGRFLSAPEAALADQALTCEERADLMAIDRTGLVMASHSYYRKRQGRRKPTGWRSFFRRIFERVTLTSRAGFLVLLPLFSLLSVTWVFPASPWEPVGNPPGRWLASLLVHGGRIFAGTDSGLYRSADGRAWEQVLDLDQVNSLAARGSTLFAGGSGLLHRSDDGGASWEPVKAGGWGLPAVAWHGNRLFASDRGAGVMRSWDNGETWTALDLGIPRAVASSLASTGRSLFAGGPWGILRSTDEGESWKLLTSGPGLSVGHMAARPGVLYAAGYPDCVVSRSVDEGRTWTELVGFRPAFLSHLVAADGFVLASGPDGVFRYSEAARAWTRLPGSDSPGQAPLVPVGTDLYAGGSIGIYRFKGWKGGLYYSITPR